MRWLIMFICLFLRNPVVQPNSGIVSDIERSAHNYHGILSSIQDGEDSYFYRDGKKCAIFTEKFLKYYYIKETEPMPKVHYVKKARKDNRVVKAGESYYWWKFAFGPKMLSKEKPMPWQLTRSSFLQTLYQLQHEIENMSVPESIEDLKQAMEDIKSQIETMKDECQDSLDAMPEHLQDTSDSGITLTERIEALEQWIDEYDSLSFNDEPAENETQVEFMERMFEEFQNVQYEG